MPDDFGAAFALASAAEESSAAPVALGTPTQPAVAGAPGAPIVPATSPPATAPGAPETPAPSAETAGLAAGALDESEPTGLELPEVPLAPAAPAALPTPELTENDFMRRFAALMQKAEPAAPAPAPPVYAPQQQQSLYSVEEMTRLNQFYNDWPDIAGPAQLMAQGMVRQAMAAMYADIAATLAPHLAMIGTLADRSQLGDIRERVADYDTVADQLEGWVGKQPAYLQPAYRHVMTEGTADEVADLIERYKREGGGALLGQQVPAAPVGLSKVVSELSPVVKKAAAALAPVGSKRSTVGASEPLDFISAFEAFAKAG